MLEPAKDWRLIRPDFSDREKYEAAGWQKIDAGGMVPKGNDYSIEEIGSVDAGQIVIYVVKYRNEDLKLTAYTFDFFGQGIVCETWVKDGAFPLDCGAAIQVKEGEWIIKETDEILDFLPKEKLIGNRRIIYCFTVVFFKSDPKSKSLKAAVRLEVQKDPD